MSSRTHDKVQQLLIRLRVSHTHNERVICYSTGSSTNQILLGPRNPGVLHTQILQEKASATSHSIQKMQRVLIDPATLIPV